MTVSHWPTFADSLFWCACDNRTFDTQEAWQQHVADAVLAEHDLTPPETADQPPHRGS